MGDVPPEVLARLSPVDAATTFPESDEMFATTLTRGADRLVVSLSATPFEMAVLQVDITSVAGENASRTHEGHGDRRVPVHRHRIGVYARSRDEAVLKIARWSTQMGLLFARFDAAGFDNEHEDGGEVMIGDDKWAIGTTQASAGVRLAVADALEQLRYS